MCGSVASVVSATPLKKRHSLNEPFGPPSPLAPLSEITTIERVVELARLLEVVEDATDLVVGVRDVAGEHLGHAGEQALLVVAQRVPRPHGVEQRPGLAVGTGALGLAVRVDRRELGVLGQQAELLLALEDAGADRLVALVELALVLVGPLRGHVVRRVTGARREVHEERLVGIDDLGRLDEADRLVGEVLRRGGSPSSGVAGRLDLAGCRARGRDTTGSISPPRQP